MGMFDYIDWQADCRNCGKPLTGFQSKDGPCELSTLPVTAVMNFYTSCDVCEAWNEFKVTATAVSVSHDEDRERAADEIRQTGR